MENFLGIRRIKENNDTKDLILICNALIEIIKKIIDNPNDESKRNIKLESLEVLMSFSGGMETLFEIGFIEV
jgi:hypothetical protein